MSKFYDRIKKEAAERYFRNYNLSQSTRDQLVQRYWKYWADCGGIHWTADVSGAAHAILFLKKRGISEYEALSMIPKTFGCFTAYESLTTWAETLGLSSRHAYTIAKEFSWLYSGGGLAYGADFFKRIRELKAA